jgi:uncharacterized membrane protein YeiH
MTEVLTVPAVMETASILGGGISGALHARTRDMDYLGALIVAVATGVGGGAIRDIMLGEVPVFLLNMFVPLAVLGAVAAFFFARLLEKVTPFMFVLDTLLIGAWVVIGAEKAINAGLPPIAVVFVGATTAIGGGLLRDVLCRDIPTALMPGRYVAASGLIASIVFTSLWSVGLEGLAEAAALITATLLRALSFHYEWVTPSAMDMSNTFRDWVGLPERKTASGKGSG